MIDTKKINISLLTEIPKIVITGLDVKEDNDVKTASFLPINIKNTDCLNNKIIYQNDKDIGIIRKKNDKQYIEVFKDVFEELNQDLGHNIVFGNLKSNTICKGDLIYSNNIIQEIKKKTIKYKDSINRNTVNYIDFTVYDDENILISEIIKQKFDINILIYVCDESDIPSNSNLKTGNGCGIIVQDNGYLMPLNLQKRMQEILSSKTELLKYQTCFAKRSSVLEKISINGSSPAIGIIIPVKHTDTELAECDVNDIKSAVDTACFIADKITENAE